MIGKGYFKNADLHSADVYGMIMFGTVGMLGLTASNDLITLFISLETMSICLYVMAGLFKNEKFGAEAALKYFLLGAFSIGFFLYGIVLIYSGSGTLNIL